MVSVLNFLKQEQWRPRLFKVWTVVVSEACTATCDIELWCTKWGKKSSSHEVYLISLAPDSSPWSEVPSSQYVRYRFLSQSALCLGDFYQELIWNHIWAASLMGPIAMKTFLHHWATFVKGLQEEEIEDTHFTADQKSESQILSCHLHVSSSVKKVTILNRVKTIK